ncbi:hypothetical protein TWF694_000923 [Orbilia ellipsospora]|uniref:F-box domain-containing protein n=1 Tax=Orbilia ellipsospora TaxID=2528407 RepID=A0AAV9XQ39_9PEZI
MLRNVHNSLPLPVELVGEVLEKCLLQDLWSFAKTSREAYHICFRILVSKYRFPLTLPSAIHSGLLQQHKTGGVFNIINSVSIDISKDSWHSNLEASTIQELTSFLKSKERYIESDEFALGLTPVDIKIYTPKGCGDCFIPAFVTIFKLVFSTTPFNINSLTLRFSVAQDEESDFKREVSELRKYTIALLPKRSDFRTLPLKSLSIEITAFNSRTTVQYLIELMSYSIIICDDFIENKTNLESLKIVVKWKEESYQSSTDTAPYPRIDIIWHCYLPAPRLKKFHFEDKLWSSYAMVSRDLDAYNQEVEDLYIDCGMGMFVRSGQRLSNLKDLRKFSLIFPYREFGLDLTNCLRCYFRHWVQREGGLHDLIFGGLEEIQVQFLWHDAKFTNTTRFSISYEKVPELGDGIRRKVHMEDLGDKPTDIIDLEILRADLQKSKRRGNGRWLFGYAQLAQAYSNYGDYVQELLEKGDELDTSLVPGPSYRNSNRRGVRCEKCEEVFRSGFFGW